MPADYESNDARRSVGLRLGSNGLLEYSGGYQDQQDLDYTGRLLDATYFKTRSHDLELTAALLNATDRAYAHHLNSPNPFTGERILEPGRAFKIGMRFTP